MSRSTVACGRAVSESPGQERGLGFAGFGGLASFAWYQQSVWWAPIKRRAYHNLAVEEARSRSLASIDGPSVGTCSIVWRR